MQEIIHEIVSETVQADRGMLLSFCLRMALAFLVLDGHFLLRKIHGRSFNVAGGVIKVPVLSKYHL